MKVKDVTSKRKQEVKLIKMHSPNKDSKVRIYETPTTRYIHEFTSERQVLSISNDDMNITEPELVYGIKKIMKLDFSEVELTVRPSGVLFLYKKGKSLSTISSVLH